MKKELWVVITVVAVFMGLIIGYSIPPMLEAGMIFGEKSEIGLKSEVSQELENYYKNLADENK
jgi:hypothetical protein